MRGRRDSPTASSSSIGAGAEPLREIVPADKRFGGREQVASGPPSAVAKARLELFSRRVACSVTCSASDTEQTHALRRQELQNGNDGFGAFSPRHPPRRSVSRTGTTTTWSTAVVERCGGGVEPPQGLDHVADELQPDRLFVGGGRRRRCRRGPRTIRARPRDPRARSPHRRAGRPGRAAQSRCRIGFRSRLAAAGPTHRRVATEPRPRRRRAAPDPWPPDRARATVRRRL